MEMDEKIQAHVSFQFGKKVGGFSAVKAVKVC